MGAHSWPFVVHMREAPVCMTTTRVSFALLIVRKKSPLTVGSADTLMGVSTTVRHIMSGLFPVVIETPPIIPLEDMPPSIFSSIFSSGNISWRVVVCISSRVWAATLWPSSSSVVVPQPSSVEQVVVVSVP